MNRKMLKFFKFLKLFQWQITERSSANKSKRSEIKVFFKKKNPKIEHQLISKKKNLIFKFEKHHFKQVLVFF